MFLSFYLDPAWLVGSLLGHERLVRVVGGDYLRVAGTVVVSSVERDG